MSNILKNNSIKNCGKYGKSRLETNLNNNLSTYRNDLRIEGQPSHQESEKYNWKKDSPRVDLNIFII